ncbi:MAG: cytochrome c biogenesis protein CcsA [Myxococcota bacterium]
MSAASRTGTPPLGWTLLGLTTVGLLGIAIYSIFFLAPVEEQMGVVQKIFYFHVPSAYAMYLGFAICAVCSGLYLFRQQERWDAVAVAAAEVGVLFCAVVLVSGPLWARKAWGVWWTWDPRLTTTMLAGMIFVAYLSLRSFGTVGDAEKRFAAALALAGLCVLPIIHKSVDLWRGQHPTVITSQGGGLDAAMWLALALSFLAFTALVTWLIWTRARIESNRARVEALQSFAVQQGLFEER